MELLWVPWFVKLNMLKVKLIFKHKMSIAQNEINETLYWLELLKETGYLTDEQFQSINNDAVEIINRRTSIIKSTKANINN